MALKVYKPRNIFRTEHPDGPDAETGE